MKILRFMVCLDIHKESVAISVAEAGRVSKEGGIVALSGSPDRSKGSADIGSLVNSASAPTATVVQRRTRVDGHAVRL